MTPDSGRMHGFDLARGSRDRVFNAGQEAPSIPGPERVARLVTDPLGLWPVLQQRMLHPRPDHTSRKVRAGGFLPGDGIGVRTQPDQKSAVNAVTTLPPPAGSQSTQRVPANTINWRTRVSGSACFCVTTTPYRQPRIQTQLAAVLATQKGEL